MNDPSLHIDRRDCIHYDWYHIFVINGLYQKEIQGLATFLTYKKIDIENIRAFLRKWKWPNTTASPRDMFNDFDVNSDHIKCDGHTCTGSYEVLRFFVASVLLPKNLCVPQCNSFVALCCVLDLLLAARHGVADPRALLVATVTYLRTHLDAYGPHLWVPKHHLAMHLADQIVKHCLLLACNIHEILHKLITRWTHDRYTRVGFETGCMEEVTLQHLHNMSTPWLNDGLVEPHAPCRNLAGLMSTYYGDATVTTARITRANGRQYCAGDYAYARLEGRMTLVLMEFHVSVDGLARTCAYLFKDAPSPDDTQWCKTYVRLAHGFRVFPSDCLVAPVTYLKDGDCVAALVPACVRL